MCRQGAAAMDVSVFGESGMFQGADRMEGMVEMVEM